MLFRFGTLFASSVMHSKFQKLAFQNVVVGSKNFWWLALDVQYYEDHIEPKLNEEWREIELDSRKFRVSSLGRIQLTNGEITQGSLHIGHRKTAREGYLVHRLVALAFCPKEGKEYVNNIDGDSTNNNASNLEWCTPKENMQHVVRLGLRNSKDSNSRISIHS
ncbi:hypothetical protein RclHR1_01790017 [Rhizophagus clarus]|uniref:HNH nuclease domain-containing protein n=1 Tax=Rhizophagus clarus TaxID=94130 RepID=A0A2Z6QL63_9GLOM|nr:hypothetical protein RclHR1_01790017 [Rhizophagus clarus]